MTVKTITWPEAPSKGDAADFTGTDADLRALIASARPFDAERAVVPLAATLDALCAFVRRYVVLTAPQLVAIALWIAHTHAIEAADATPYLRIGSAEKRSGKTRLLEVLALLVARAWLTGRTSAAALIRKVDKLGPTLLLDEADAAFNGDKEYSETLRGVLNSGHRRGGVASLCVGQGAALDVRDFNTFCPKAIAGIGKLPDTVTDRSIPIEMARRAPGETVERFRHRDAAAVAAPLSSALADWAASAIAALREANPLIPDALGDRAADGWEPLLAIADLAGDDWPQRARDAAIELSGFAAREDDSIGVRLLHDVRSIFAAKGADRLFSEDLASALRALEESSWGAWGKRDKPLDKPALARLLVRYQIRPKQIRIGADTAKGYLLEGFADAFARYLPPSERNTETSESGGAASESDTEPKQAGLPDLSVSEPNANDGADSDSESPDCFGVSDDVSSTGVTGDTRNGSALTCADCGSTEITMQGGSDRFYCADHARRCPPTNGHPDALCDGCGAIAWRPRASGGWVCASCTPCVQPVLGAL